jgi:phosphoglycolate phosphatase
MLPIRLLIFDLDGTLIDSLPDLADAANQMREHFQLSRLPLHDVRKLVGQGARSLVERALPGATQEQVDEGLQLFLSYNLDHITDKTTVYPGVPETLQALQSRGLELCILSNKNVALCREVVAALGIDSFFPTVMGADSFPTRKPSPEPVQALVKQFKVATREAVMIGDSINDMAAGEGAGVITVGCRYGYGEASELAGADFKIPDFPSLLSLPILA